MAHSLQHATHVVSGKSTFPPGSKVMIVKYKMGFSFAHERASIRLVLKAPVLPIDAAGTQPFHTATPIIRSVAQLGSALQWGCKGRRFESCRSDQKDIEKQPLSELSQRLFFADSSLGSI